MVVLYNPRTKCRNDYYPIKITFFKNSFLQKSTPVYHKIIENSKLVENMSKNKRGVTNNQFSNMGTQKETKVNGLKLYGQSDFTNFPRLNIFHKIISKCHIGDLASSPAILPVKETFLFLINSDIAIKQ